MDIILYVQRLLSQEFSRPDVDFVLGRGEKKLPSSLGFHAIPKPRTRHNPRRQHRLAKTHRRESWKATELHIEPTNTIQDLRQSLPQRHLPPPKTIYPRLQTPNHNTKIPNLPQHPRMETRRPSNLEQLHRRSKPSRRRLYIPIQQPQPQTLSTPPSPQTPPNPRRKISILLHQLRQAQTPHQKTVEHVPETRHHWPPTHFRNLDLQRQVQRWRAHVAQD